MTRKTKIVTVLTALLVVAGGTVWLLTRKAGSDGDATMGQKVNAAIDNLVAAGIRLLELPVIVLLLGAGVTAVVMALPVLRWGTKSGRMTAARLGAAALVGMIVVGMGMAVDRKLGQLQGQVNDLRGKLSQEQMARIQSMNDAPAVAVAPAAAPVTPAAPASAVPVVRVPAQNVTQNSGPAAPTTPVIKPAPAATPAVTPSAAKAKRDRMMVDAVAVPQSLAILWGQIGFHPVIHDEATDIVKVEIASPPVVAYMAVVNLKTPGLEIKYGGSLTAKTLTSDFAKTNNCQIAINGEAGQSPQANSGLGAWRGHMMTEGKTLMTEQPANKRPFLSFDKGGQPTFTAMAAADRALRPDAYNVIWGRLDAVIDGKLQTENERDRQPRTAMGINQDGSTLYLLVVDGRQQGYSLGFTREEVGVFMQIFGATNGMLCDEGGSSCIYMKKFNGIVNSPSDGVERTTYTHFGISLKGS